MKEQSLKKLELLDDIMHETEELIKIFDTSIRTAENKRKWPFKVRHWFFHSTLDVRCSMLDVHLLNKLGAYGMDEWNGWTGLLLTTRGLKKS